MSEETVEIGQLWLHLTTGTAGIHGFVPGEDRGPEVGGVMRAALPIGQGGSVRLFEGMDPHWFDDHGFNWAGRTTNDVQAEAERHGWRTITRRQAAQRMAEQDYLLYPRRDDTGRAHLHQVLWSDQVDDLTWHVRESWDGFRFTYERCVFVERTVLSAEQPELAIAR